MALLKTNAHVGNPAHQVVFSYPGSSGVAHPRADRLQRVQGSSFWHLQISDDEAARLKNLGFPVID